MVGKCKVCGRVEWNKRDLSANKIEPLCLTCDGRLWWGWIYPAWDEWTEQAVRETEAEELFA